MPRRRGRGGTGGSNVVGCGSVPATGLREPRARTPEHRRRRRIPCSGRRRPSLRRISCRSGRAQPDRGRTQRSRALAGPRSWRGWMTRTVPVEHRSEECGVPDSCGSGPRGSGGRAGQVERGLRYGSGRRTRCSGPGTGRRSLIGATPCGSGYGNALRADVGRAWDGRSPWNSVNRSSLAFAEGFRTRPPGRRRSVS